jgi:hypothetical protein
MSLIPQPLVAMYWCIRDDDPKRPCAFCEKPAVCIARFRFGGSKLFPVARGSRSLCLKHRIQFIAEANR